MEAGAFANDFAALSLALLLVLLNAFFVAAEFALVSIRRTRIEEMVQQKKPGARAVQKAQQNTNESLAAAQIGITLASLGLGWVGEPALARFMDPLAALIPISANWSNVTAHALSAIVAFGVITLLHVVIGEQIPKSMALQQSERIALVIAQPTLWVIALLRPGVWAMNGISNLLLRLMGFRPVSGHDQVHSVDEIKMVMAASATQGVLEDAEVNMVDAIFDLREMMIRQLMVPRTEMIALPDDATLRDVMALHKENRHGKFPIYKKDVDNIIGMAYMRDMVGSLASGHLNTPVKEFIREAIFLPETARINAALVAFRAKRQRAAIVLDEYSGTAGLITLEDIIEEISGEIPDQFETLQKPDIIRRQDGSWEISGLTRIDDLNEELLLHLSDENYDTMAGYVMGKLERIPAVGDEIRDGDIYFRVEQIDGMRIDRIQMILLEGRNEKPQSG